MSNDYNTEKRNTVDGNLKCFSMCLSCRFTYDDTVIERHRYSFLCRSNNKDLDS